jgi:hypothetical protein
MLLLCALGFASRLPVILKWGTLTKQFGQLKNCAASTSSSPCLFQRLPDQVPSSALQPLRCVPRTLLSTCFLKITGTLRCLISLLKISPKHCFTIMEGSVPMITSTREQNAAGSESYYRYGSLESLPLKSIRLLRIYPGSSDLIECFLTPICLTEKPRFDSLVVHVG